MSDDHPGFDRRTLLAAVAGIATTLGVIAKPGVEAAPAELRIGFQKGSLNLALLKLLGLLEPRLPNTRVSWIEFPAGPQLLEALAVGSVDVGATGDAPPVFAQAAGKDLLYVGAEPPKPDSSAVLVRADGTLRTLADLKGRRVAVQRGSSAHYLLVRALEKAKLGWADIVPQYLPPADARAAFEKGAVDAWVVWDPYYAALEISAQPRVLATSRGLTGNNTFYLASRSFAGRHAATLQTLFAALTEADAATREQRRDSAQRLADFTGLSLATVYRVIERRQPSPVRPLTPALVAEQQDVADTFHRLGLIPRAIRIADIVWQPGRSL